MAFVAAFLAFFNYVDFFLRIFQPPDRGLMFKMPDACENHTHS